MKEITFVVEPCEETGMLVASWDNPGGQGGIVTQGQDLRDLEEMVKDAVHCHFEGAEIPEKIRLHFITDPVLMSR